jgi:DNA uptake protein ComE-like DNA-binding protein
MIEAQATEAEERAVHAERLVELKKEEGEREKDVQRMLDRINEAERRAREAERRAREAVAVAARRPAEESASPESGPAAPTPHTPPQAAPGQPPAPAPTAEAAPPAVAPEVVAAAAAEQPGASAPEAGEEGSINLNQASFDELRSAGFSVTQTGRLLAYRERSGGFRSVEELDSIPGFPKEFLDSVKHRLEA